MRHWKNLFKSHSRSDQSCLVKNKNIPNWQISVKMLLFYTVLEMEKKTYQQNIELIVCYVDGTDGLIFLMFGIYRYHKGLVSKSVSKSVC